MFWLAFAFALAFAAATPPRQDVLDVLLAGSDQQAAPPEPEPALCPSGVGGWDDFAAVCCSPECGQCDANGCQRLLGAHSATRPGCCPQKLAHNGRACRARGDTGCVGVPTATSSDLQSGAVQHAFAAGQQGQQSDGAPPRILGLTSSSCKAADTNARLRDTIERSCRRYAGLRVVVNFFDADDGQECFEQGRPDCVERVTNVAGHKSAFWLAEGRSELAESYDFVVAFDNDMRVGDEGFDLERATRLLQASGAAIAQPRIQIGEDASEARRLSGAPNASFLSPVGAASSSQVGLFRTGTNESGATIVIGGWDFLTDPLLPACAAQTVAYVENQVPIFTQRGWGAVHTHLLQRLDPSIFNSSNWGLSATWCRLAQRYSGHALGCVIVDELLATTNEQTIERLGLTSKVRTGTQTHPSLRRTFPAEYLGKIEGEVWFKQRGGCALSTDDSTDAFRPARAYHVGPIGVASNRVGGA